MAEDLGASFAASLLLEEKYAQHHWPSPRYRANPVAFFRDVLGVEPWERQVEIIEAVRDNPRVAVASGHKVSKSHTAGGIALWFYSSYEDARVVMSSTTSRQVDQILWREVKMMHARSGRCVACKSEEKARAERKEPIGPRPCPHSLLLDGEPRELARTGIKSPDFREVVGFTAREAEAVAGVSGKNLLYIVDEASGVPDAIFEAIEGNRAGGARIVMFSNPTRTEGEFFEAFHGKSAFYKAIRVSSEETPNVKAGRVLIPGLATREWVEEKRAEWGEESPLYKVRVKGEFVVKEDGKIITIHAIGEAEARWLDTPPSGRLYVGLDPAGEGSDGDETVFAPRRGQRVISLLPMRGLNEDGILANLLGVLREHKLANEPPPFVVLDSEGSIGSKVAIRLRAFLDVPGNENEFVLVCVKASQWASREPQNYERVRDELWANLARWLRDGGAIPADAKLAKELHSPSWVHLVNGKSKVTPKEEMKKLLKRSPDRADAVALATWEPVDYESRADAGQRAAHAQPTDDRVPTLDPYSAESTWRRQ